MPSLRDVRKRCRLKALLYNIPTALVYIIYIYIIYANRTHANFLYSLWLRGEVAAKRLRCCGNVKTSIGSKNRDL